MRRNNKGFTLVEIMIVLAILGAIFGLLAGRITGARDKAAMREAKIQMGQITNALSMYYTDCGKYPSNLDGLKKQDSGCSNWGPEPYYKNKLVDPWKHDFVYEGTGGDFKLKSLGRDGNEGGDGYDKDINSEETEEESSGK